ncbi:MAG: pyruvoyl-dependent arginine decarboxylase [Frankiaceae bacterium]
MWYDVERVILIAGAASGNQPLAAFDYALRRAGIADFNLIKVTSIVPPGVEIRTLRPGAHPVLGEGRMVPTIYAREDSSEEGAIFSAAVGVGVPIGLKVQAGLVYVSSGRQSEAESVRRVEDMVRDGMEVRGTEKYEVVVQSAGIEVVPPWSSVTAAAIFCDQDILRLFRPGDVIKLVGNAY